MNREMIECVDNVCGDLQVTLRFEFHERAILDKAVLKTRIQERLLPLIKNKILEGTVWLRNIPFAETDRFSTVLRAGQTDLPVTWKVHRPWWADDNPDWDKVPFASVTTVKDVPHAT